MFSKSVLLLLLLPVVAWQTASARHGGQRAELAGPEGQAEGVWVMQSSGVKASLRGLAVVDAKIVWASGSGGTVIRTLDSGRTWKKVSVKQAPELDFRDIHAFDANRAIVLSAGQPARIYQTVDGGGSWKLCFEHPNKKSFFDALSFADENYGIAMSDPVDDRVLLIESNDGGETWAELPSERRPKALKGEAGFAASGTNMRIVGKRILIALGGAEKGQRKSKSRIVYSDDRAKTWQAAEVPIARSESSGIFSVHFTDKKNGVVVGGDYLQPESKSGNIAVTNDGGLTWKTPSGTPPFGFRSGVAHFQSGDESVLVCVGTNGTDVSIDGGNNWKKVSENGFHAIAFTKGNFGWATGGDGTVARWNQNWDATKKRSVTPTQSR